MRRVSTQHSRADLDDSRSVVLSVPGNSYSISRHLSQYDHGRGSIRKGACPVIPGQRILKAVDVGVDNQTGIGMGRSPQNMKDLTLEPTLLEIKRLLRALSGTESGEYYENSFQMPNLVIDLLDFYLTPIESKVLHRVIREILGWKKRIAFDKNIVSVSKMIRGYIADDGKVSCLGIGLTRETVEKTLGQLCQFGILVKENQKQKGYIYRFNDNTSEYDIEKLIQRVEERKVIGKKRMEKARQYNHKVMELL